MSTDYKNGYKRAHEILHDSRREFEKTELFNEGYLPTGIRHQITLQVHSSGFGLTTISFCRVSKNFTDWERELLDTLIPHYQLVTDRLLRGQQVIEAFREVLPIYHTSYPFIAFDNQFYLYDANSSAMKLLNSLIDFDGRMLPPAIVQSIALQAHGNAAINSHVILRNQCYLIRGAPSENPFFRYVSLQPQNAAQINEERSEEINLTRRESEIALWVKQGKTNREIAAILGISSRTVSKHLENIFAKLHIENRYALLFER